MTADKIGLNKEQQILRHFDSRVDYWHDVYSGNSFAAYSLQKRQKCVLELCQKREPPSSILDVGCGAGATALQLVLQGNRVTGIDVSPQMIERAKAEAVRLGLECEFQVGQATHLPYPQTSFDRVIGMGLVEYLSDDRPVLAEMYRVLKPGGELIVNIPNSTSLYRLIAFPRSLPVVLGPDFKRWARSVENSLRHVAGLLPKDISNSWLGRAVRPGAFSKHLSKLGFESIQYIPLTYGPFHPFGIHFWEDKTDIRRSEAVLEWVTRHDKLRWGASTVVYQARRPLS